MPFHFDRADGDEHDGDKRGIGSGSRAFCILHHSSILLPRTHTARRTSFVRCHQIDAVADEVGMYTCLAKSMEVFEQAVYMKVAEDNDRDPRETFYPYREGRVTDTVSNAMVTALKENLVEFEHLEEASDR